MSHPPSVPPGSSLLRNAVAAVAAFSVYFCMYAFRKPFTAATLEGEQWMHYALKTVLVLAQLSGYMLSKFIGIKLVSEMPRHRRAVSIVTLIVIAELALLGYAYAPMSAKILLLFLNGLSLGVIFGLVLAYLEGRCHTEAMSAILCGSFIASSGFVKSVGRALMTHLGVSEFQMPYLTGLVFLLPLLVSVWVLDRTPEPSPQDIRQRQRRALMDAATRWQFFRAYAPGLVLLIGIYTALTVIRTIRDDFGVEIWQELGVVEQPSVFARSETLVAIIVTALSGLAIAIRDNLRALTTVFGCMLFGFVMIGVAIFLQRQGAIAPFPFMVVCGVGLYIPYVNFHTAVFERIVAASPRPANIGFLMYLADSIGYLGYAIFAFSQLRFPLESGFLGIFITATLVTIVGSVVALLICLVYFPQVLSRRDAEVPPSSSGRPPTPLATSS